MASSKTTVEHIVDQASGAGGVRARAMFGEYGIYCGEKMVALVCNDTLFIKKTDAGLAMLDGVEEASPYPGAKPLPIVSEELWDDAEWMARLFAVTAEGLPLPKKKKPKKN